MRKSINKRLYARRALAAGLSMLLAVASVPDGTYAAMAAAKKPAVAKTATVVMNGTKKITMKGNGYKIISAKWKTSKKSVAQITGTKAAGTVYGVKSGTATITATVKAKKSGKTKSFKLTSKVTVKAPGASLSEKTLRVGGTAAVKVANAPAKAKITYASQDKSVATVDSKGKVTALKAGTTKITAKVVLPKTKYAKKTTKTLTAGTLTVKGTDGDNTTSATPAASAEVPASAAPSAPASAAPASVAPSATPEVTPNPALAATVTSQAELDAALKANEPKVVTIGDVSGALNIAEGNYDKIDLVVNAPKATITNYGKFKTITIQAIAGDTWIEKGDGNSIIASAKSPLHIVIDTLKRVASLIFKGTSVTANKVEVKSGTVGAINVQSTEPVNITAEGTAKVEAVTVEAAADVDVQTKGNSEIAKVSVEAAGADVDVTASETSKVGSVEVTEKASSADGTEAAKQTKLDVKADGSAKVETVATSAANAAVTVVSDGESTVSTVKVTGDAEATVSGNSKNVTTLDVTGATEKAKVEVKTDTVKVETASGVKTDDIIQNTSGKPLETTTTNADGSTTQTMTQTDGGGYWSGGSGGSTQTSVTGVEITGTPKVGDTLSATYTPANPTNVSSHQWQWAVASNAVDTDWHDIDSATGKTYTVPAKFGEETAVGKFIRVVVNETIKSEGKEIGNPAINVKLVQGGTIESSVASATIGTEITLTATPTVGYEFGAWVVTKAGDANTKVTVTDNKFEMPAYSVDVTATFTQKEVSSISVKTAPTKVKYVKGESFDPTGLVIVATFGDETTGDIAYSDATKADFTFAPATNAALNEETSVSITYGGKSTTQDITIVTLSSIAVKTAPTKVKYVKGERFDPTGLVITLTYSDNSTKDVTYNATPETGNAADFTFSPATSAALNEETSVSITYAGKTTTQTITVTEGD